MGDRFFLFSFSYSVSSLLSVSDRILRHPFFIIIIIDVFFRFLLLFIILIVLFIRIDSHFFPLLLFHHSEFDRVSTDPSPNSVSLLLSLFFFYWPRFLLTHIYKRRIDRSLILLSPTPRRTDVVKDR